jgi:hypothetical protein
MEYKHIFKKHGLTVSKLAEMSGAKSEMSFRNSSAYKRYINLAVELIQHIEKSITTKING